MSAWSEYVVRVAGTDVSTAIADRTGVSQPTISRWLKADKKPSAGHAAKFALTYGVDVLETFVAAGLLTPEEAGLGDVIDRELVRLAREREFALRAVRVAEKNLEQVELELAQAQHERGKYAFVHDPVPPPADFTSTPEDAAVLPDAESYDL